jgi:hypothetical protein
VAQFFDPPCPVEALELDQARRIAAAAESSRIDPPFQNALPMALGVLAVAGSFAGRLTVGRAGPRGIGGLVVWFVAWSIGCIDASLL